MLMHNFLQPSFFYLHLFVLVEINNLYLNLTSKTLKKSGLSMYGSWVSPFPSALSDMDHSQTKEQNIPQNKRNLFHSHMTPQQSPCALSQWRRIWAPLEQKKKGSPGGVPSPTLIFIWIWMDLEGSATGDTTMHVRQAKTKNDVPALSITSRGWRGVYVVGLDPPFSFVLWRCFRLRMRVYTATWFPIQVHSLT